MANISSSGFKLQALQQPKGKPQPPATQKPAQSGAPSLSDAYSQAAQKALKKKH
jgi:hypothetical protein